MSPRAPLPVAAPLRGFARLSPERRREIARAGGSASAASAKHTRFTPDTARAARRSRRRPKQEVA